MRGRLLVFVGVFCVALLVVSGATAGKPDKPPKPPKPEEPDTSNAECIVFEGPPDAPNLAGSQEVEGCCPNAGPFPLYTMTLEDLGHLPDGTYDGHLFINNYGAGRNRKYIVQFWNDDLGIAFEIIGGVIENDKKNKILTVTFEDETGFDVFQDPPIPIEHVSFTLVRSSDLSYCE